MQRLRHINRRAMPQMQGIPSPRAESRKTLLRQRLETRKTPKIEMTASKKMMVMGCEAMTLFIPPDTDRQCSGTYVAHAHYAGRRIDSEPSASPWAAVVSLRKRLAAVMTPCSYTCTPDDHLRYADRGKCSLCGREFNPPNADVMASMPRASTDTPTKH